MKDLTGGDRLRARRMREDFWEFAPTHKIVLCTNHKPRVRGTDYATWRRLRLIPFSAQIEDDRQDKQLGVKLRKELSGILAWCVRGCSSWLKDGLGTPDAVKDATKTYRSEQDLFAEFLSEKCNTGIGSEYKIVSAKEIYKVFVVWCTESNNGTPMNTRKFGQEMTERGFERFTNNGTYYRGIGLRQEDEINY